MQDPDEVPKTICASAAQALFRYHQFSGEGLEDMPESFVQSFIADHLGCVLTFTLETSFYKIAKIANKQDENHPWNNRTFDMAIYDYYAGKSRSDTHFLGVAEMKKGNYVKQIKADIGKIQDFVTLGVPMSFGAVLFYCSLAEVPTAEADARNAGHQWFSIGVPTFPDYPDDRYIACIRWFNPSARAQGSR
jgi:hypothetical protein